VSVESGEGLEGSKGVGGWALRSGGLEVGRVYHNRQDGQDGTRQDRGVLDVGSGVHGNHRGDYRTGSEHVS